MGPNQNSVVLTLRSTSEAKAGSVHPIRIVGTARAGQLELQAIARVNEVLKEEFNNIPYPPMALAEATAVGVGPRPAFTLHTEPAQIIFGHGLSATVKVIAERQKGFDEPIAVAVMQEKLPPVPNNPPKFADVLPPGITAAAKPIAKGANSTEITFHADNRPALSEFTAVLVGTLKKGNDERTSPTPGIGLKLDIPFRLSVNPAAGKLSRKGELKLKIGVQRNPAFQGEIAIAVSRLPKGVTARPAKIAAKATEGEIVLSAAPDAAAGAASNIRVTASAPIGGSQFSQRASIAKIAVE
jgi:hypothetical protein